MASPASSSSSGNATGSSSSGGGGDSALRTFENAFDRFSTGVQTLASTSQIAQKRLEVEFSSLDSCVNRHTAQLQEYRKLEDMLDELEGQAKEGTDAQLHDYRLKLQLLKSALDKLKETKPRIDNGLFVRLMYGRVNIALWKQADRLMFKDEYNKFKSRTTLLFLLWPCLQLVLMYVFPDLWRSQGELLLKIHQLWLLYYYLTLSLRENILLANDLYVHLCEHAPVPERVPDPVSSDRDDGVRRRPGVRHAVPEQLPEEAPVHAEGARQGEGDRRGLDRDAPGEAVRPQDTHTDALPAVRDGVLVRRVVHLSLPSGSVRHSLRPRVPGERPPDGTRLHRARTRQRVLDRHRAGEQEQEPPTDARDQGASHRRRRQ